MSKLPEALWVNVSPSLRRFDRSLLEVLSGQMILAQWQYCQTADEPTSLTIALDLLHDYVKQIEGPLHLLGHGTGWLLAWLYALRSPERVRSLTLLSVGAYPAVDWQAHYYVQLQLLPHSREIILAQTVYNLFGSQSRSMTRKLVEILERDLNSSLSPHSLYQRVSIFPSKVSVPLLVCGSEDDVVVEPDLLWGWQPWLKQGDRLWSCPSGRYFFHHFHPQQVSEQIQDFWNSLANLTYLPANLNTNFR